MSRKVRLAAAAVMVLISGLVWIARPRAIQADDPPPPAELVEQLGAESYQVRQEATRQLAEQGEQVRATLERAATSPDVEIGLRARRLLESLEEEQLWQPSLCGPFAASTGPRSPVQLAAMTEIPPGTALASQLLKHIAEQTGNRILLGDSFGSFHDAPVSPPAGERIPFWKAVETICRQSGNYVRPRYHGEDRGLVVVAGPPENYPTAYAGPFRATITSTRRVFAEEADYQSGHQRVSHTFQIGFQLLWEDRLQLMAFGNQPELVEARAEPTTELWASQTEPSGWNVVTPARRQLAFQLKLDPPPWKAPTLKVLRIRLPLLAAAEPNTIVLAHLRAGLTRQFPDLTVTVEEVRTKGSGWEITLTLLPETIVPDPPEVLCHENEFVARDAQGQTLPLQERSSWLTEQGVRYSLLFAGQSPHSLTITYPQLRSCRDVEFVWRDVPLPRSLPE